jgi:hypothetical protein
MKRDNRYSLVKPLMSTGHIRTFQDLFKFIPKTVIDKDLGMNYTRFTRLIENVDDFILRDLFRLADLFEIDELALLNLVHEQYQMDKKSKKKVK